MSEITRRDFLKTTGALAAGSLLGGIGPSETSHGQTVSTSGVPSTGGALSLPNGGGAIQGIGETFNVNRFTGTGTFTVPIGSISPGRAGFGPELSLQYSTGQGSGAHGLGWNLTVPQISRKTEKGIPKYQGNDVFLLSGAEDLVEHADYLVTKHEGFRITTYRPRVEGLFARIQRWELINKKHSKNNLSNEFWRITTKDNVTNIYGRTQNALLGDPENSDNIYQWFLQCTFDGAKGNYIHYEYLLDKGEDIPDVPYEEHRRTQNPRVWQVYLKRIRYGNLEPLHNTDLATLDRLMLQMEGADLDGNPLPPENMIRPQDHFFEVVFDYGEHGCTDENGNYLIGPRKTCPYEIYDATYPMALRPDPFSTYRAGFEIRTYRRCQRILMFHNGIPNQEYPVLVKSTDFRYEQDPDTQFSLLAAVTQRGYVEVKEKVKKSEPPNTVDESHTPLVDQETIEQVRARKAIYQSEELVFDLNIPGVRSSDYHIQSFPPVEFTYSPFAPKDEGTRRLDGLPSTSLADPNFILSDYYGRGLQDFLETTRTGFRLWKNIGDGRFLYDGSIENSPSDVTLGKPGTRLGDLNGNGLLDIIVREGFYERSAKGGWKRFRQFRQSPSILLQNRNIAFGDFTGDGRSDMVLMDGDRHTSGIFPCLGEEGYGDRVPHQLNDDSDEFLKVSLSDPNVRLASMAGGMFDLVMINGNRISYYPNLGHGKWGRKVTMSFSSETESLNLGPRFNPRRIYLADVNGNGLADLIIVDKQVRIYLNQSGNQWSEEIIIRNVPLITDHTVIEFTDILGSGTTGLLFSPEGPRKHYAFLDLVGGIKGPNTKPYLLTEVTNNLGATTKFEYTTSSKEYLLDWEDKRTWLTTLPMPVHILKATKNFNHIGRTQTVITYRYHDGYFDGQEREFRGFSRVDQFDTETFEDFINSSPPNSGAPIENAHKEFHVPPVETRTWFHTGVFYDEEVITERGQHLDQDHLLKYFRQQYYNKDRLAFEIDPVKFEGASIPRQAYHEAYRALRGSVLRTEVYARDGTDKDPHPYTVTEAGYTVRALQPPLSCPHDITTPSGVFLPYQKESLTYHYERSPDDPRIGHDLTLSVDEYANFEHRVSITYPRRWQVVPREKIQQTSHANPLPPPFQEQQRTLGTLHRQLYINHPLTHIDHCLPPDESREKYKVIPETPYFASVPYESQSFEVHNLSWDWLAYTLALSPDEPGKYTDTYRRPFRVEDFAPLVPNPREPLRYVDFWYDPTLASTDPYLRLIAWTQTYYRKNPVTEWDRETALKKESSHRLELGKLDSLGLPFETYQAVFPEDGLTRIYADMPIGTVKQNLYKGGYYRFDDDDRATKEKTHWWSPSGWQAYYAKAFYQQIGSRDPFGNLTTIYYDSETSDIGYWLRIQSTVDPVGNTTQAKTDYRVLAPTELIDPNDNRTQVAIDALGLVVGTAVRGKVGEKLGDSLEEFPLFLSKDQLKELTESQTPLQVARDIVHKAGSRFVYDLWRPKRTFVQSGKNPDKMEPAFVGNIVREQHETDPSDPEFPIQLSFTYSDGLSREIQTKILAEPDPGTSETLRWLATGWTVFNNKGKPVQQFEPFFVTDHTYIHGNTYGVSSTVVFDPLERPVATLHPSHTYEKVVFNPWEQSTWDTNDTVLAGRTAKDLPAEDDPARWKSHVFDPRHDPDVGDWFQKLPEEIYRPTWVQMRTDSKAAEELWPGEDNATRRRNEREAANQTLHHAATPTVTYLDTLARPFLIRSDCGKTKNGDRKFLETYTVWDIQGNDSMILDPRGVQAFQQACLTPDEPCRGPKIERGVVKSYASFTHEVDMSGRKLHVASVDAGRKWLIPDVLGNPLVSKDGNGHTIVFEFDALRRRPTQTWVTSFGADRPYLTEALTYGEKATPEEQKKGNLRGQVWKIQDGAGEVVNSVYDFKGNLITTNRRLLSDPTIQPDWQEPTSSELEATSYQLSMQYDALNRVTIKVEPEETSKHYTYNLRNLLTNITVNRKTKTETFVENIQYNEKGQRTKIVYGNKMQTVHTYDSKTFRLESLTTLRQKAQDSKPIQALSYVFDLIGNITLIRDESIGNECYKNLIVEPASHYEYDPLYRLTLATGREHPTMGEATSRETTHFKQSHYIPCTAHASDKNAVQPYTETYHYDDSGNLIRLAHYRGSPKRSVEGSAEVEKGAAMWVRNQIVDWQAKGDESLAHNNRLALLRPESNDPQASSSINFFGYDSNGNMTKLNETLGKLDWNFKNELVQVDLNKDGERAYYQYDSSGQRVRKYIKKKGKIQEYIYLGEFELYRERPNKEADSSLIRQMLHVMDDKNRIALLETRIDPKDIETQLSTRTRYQLTNHLGSATVEVDDSDNANIISYEQYYAYGGTAFIAGKDKDQVGLKRYRYSKKERDDETGLYYYGARYYAPWLGRWLCSDPAGLIDGSNLFTYCRNNPLVFYDNNGKESISVEPSEADIDRQEVKIDQVEDNLGSKGSEIEKNTRAKGDDLSYKFWTHGWYPSKEDNATAEQKIGEMLKNEKIPDNSRLFETEVTTKEHAKNVAYVVNYALRRYAKSGASTELILQAAQEIISWEMRDLHNGPFKDMEGFERSTESLILRDAERYLHGRAGIPRWWGWGGVASEATGSFLAPFVQQFYMSLKKVSLIPKANPEKAFSLPGGTGWFNQGLSDYWSLDKKQKSKNFAPQFLTGVRMRASFSP